MNKRRWVKALILQIVLYALMVAATVVGTLLVPTSLTGFVFHIFNWVVLPLLGGVFSYLATRRGLYYLGAWIAPPILMVAVYWAVTGIPPQHAMMVVLCALVSIIGAAAGYEMNRRKE